MMDLPVSGFDRDSGNRLKCGKHGVPLSEIESLFRNEPLVAPDPKHSREEDRLIAVGKTAAGRALFVAFTVRTLQGRRLIRPVSARYMHAKEVEAYEKEDSGSENR